MSTPTTSQHTTRSFPASSTCSPPPHRPDLTSPHNADSDNSLIFVSSSSSSSSSTTSSSSSVGTGTALNARQHRRRRTSLCHVNDMLIEPHQLLANCDEGLRVDRGVGAKEAEEIAKKVVMRSGRVGH